MTRGILIAAYINIVLIVTDIGELAMTGINVTGMTEHRDGAGKSQESKIGDHVKRRHL